MIEYDADMKELSEDDLDGILLHDEFCEHEDIEYVRKSVHDESLRLFVERATVCDSLRAQVERLRELLTASVTFNHIFCHERISAALEAGAEGNLHLWCPLYDAEANCCPYIPAKRAAADAMGIENTPEGWDAHCKTCWPSD